jgi:hypothetical protein
MCKVKKVKSQVALLPMQRVVLASYIRSKKTIPAVEGIPTKSKGRLLHNPQRISQLRQLQWPLHMIIPRWHKHVHMWFAAAALVPPLPCT